MLAHILSDLFVYWPFGALLALCLATLAAVTADRLLALRRAAGPSATLNDALRPMLAEGDLGSALGLAAANTGAFARVAGRILREGLREPGHAEAAAREAIGLELPLLERRSGAFGAIASIATLLGLAGGVLGVFSRGFGYPPGSSLAITIAHSLSDSLLCTLAGLIVAALALAARGVVHGLVERRRATLFTWLAPLRDGTPRPSGAARLRAVGMPSLRCARCSRAHAPCSTSSPPTARACGSATGGRCSSRADTGGSTRRSASRTSEVSTRGSTG